MLQSRLEGLCQGELPDVRGGALSCNFGPEFQVAGLGPFASRGSSFGASAAKGSPSFVARDLYQSPTLHPAGLRPRHEQNGLWDFGVLKV